MRIAPNTSWLKVVGVAVLMVSTREPPVRFIFDMVVICYWLSLLGEASPTQLSAPITRGLRGNTEEVQRIGLSC